MEAVRSYLSKDPNNSLGYSRVSRTLMIHAPAAGADLMSVSASFLAFSQEPGVSSDFFSLASCSVSSVTEALSNAAIGLGRIRDEKDDYSSG